MLSLGVAIILILSYVAGLWFSLRTHRDLFNAESDDDADEVDENTWTIKKSVIVLAIAGVLVGLMSEILVGSIEEASHQVGLSQFFVGVFVVAIVGNAAEHYVAVVVAIKNKMDLAVNIAIGSSAQIALFVAPVLVLLSFVFGPYPMALVFNGYELAGLIAAVLIANFLASEGESTWFEGVQLLALYLVLGLVFLLPSAAVGEQRRRDAGRERHADDRERRERADLHEVLDQQLHADDAEHHGDRLVEVAEAARQALDEHEQRAHAEQGEDVAHPDHERVARDAERGGDRVDRERDVGQDDRAEADQHRRGAPVAARAASGAPRGSCRGPAPRQSP